MLDCALEPSRRRFPSGKKAGRRKDAIAGVPHDRRPVLADQDPVSVTPPPRRALSSAMDSLNMRLTKVLNRLWGRKGRVFADRYHARAVTDGQEMRNVLEYVKNAVKAGIVPPGVLAPFSSADTHPFRNDLTVPHRQPDAWGHEPPRRWMLRGAWRRYGELSAM